jgi:hypothetical protein
MSDVETRHCSKCDRDLATSSFTQRKNGRWAAYCRQCMSLYCRNHYEKNAAKHNARRKADRTRYRLRNRKVVLDFLRSHPCIDCGETDLNVLDFDHVESQNKREEISLLSRRGRGLAELQLEMSRCVVRCANCHRRRTARQFGWAKGISLLPGCSSVGRAVRLGRTGQEFESLHSDHASRARGLTDKASAF